MAKRRIKNNFQKWLQKSIPFFLIVFFVFFTISFFIFNSSSYEKKGGIPQNATLKKVSNSSTFNFSLSIHENERIKEMLEIYRIKKDDYPPKIEDVLGNLKNKNWMYTKSADRYILEYR